MAIHDELALGSGEEVQLSKRGLLVNVAGGFQLHPEVFRRYRQLIILASLNAVVRNLMRV